MFDVPQLQCQAIREANYHIFFLDNVIWFIISQVHLPKFTYHIVLKDILSESGVKGGTGVNYP